MCTVGHDVNQHTQDDVRARSIDLPSLIRRYARGFLSGHIIVLTVDDRRCTVHGASLGLEVSTLKLCITAEKGCFL